MLSILLLGLRVSILVLGLAITTARTTQAQDRKTPTTNAEAAKLKAELERVAAELRASLPSKSETEAMKHSMDELDAKFKDLGESTLKLLEETTTACKADPECQRKMVEDPTQATEMNSAKEELQRSLEDLKRGH